MSINTDNSLKTKQWYDDNASEYTAHVRDQADSVYHHHYEKPAMYSLLPKDLSGKRVLSLGCGSGEDCSELSKRGASVAGIDISSGLIDQAIQKYPSCDFSVGNMEDLGIYSDSEFDLVYSSLAVHYLKDWSSLMSEVSRVLKPDGVFQFSMGHPMRMGMIYLDDVEGKKFKGMGRLKDPTTKEVTVIGDYFAQGPTPALGNPDGPVCYGKTLSELLELCREHQFDLIDTLDPKPLPSMEKFSPSDYAVLQKIPEFAIYVLKNKQKV